MELSSAPALAHDPWLSERMGRAAYNLKLQGDELTRSTQGALTELLSTDAFVSVKVATTSVKLLIDLQRAGFSVTDTQVVLERDTSLEEQAASEVHVRLAQQADAAPVEEVARTSFRFTRFHLDPQIPKAIADDVKARWAGNFFLGRRGDFLVVAEREGKVCGFNQLLLQGSGATLVIDLIAVSKEHQGHHAASAMIRFAARHCGTARNYRVATQVANVPSLRLYEKLGFRMAESQYVLHAHGARSRA